MEQPLGPQIGQWLARHDPDALVLRQQAGLRRAVRVGTATATLAGACAGRLPVGALLAAVRQLLGPAAPEDANVLDEVAVLAEAGILHPVRRNGDLPRNGDLAEAEPASPRT